MTRRAVAVFVLLVGISFVAAVAGPDGIALSVAHSATPGELTLAWGGDEQPYLVHRSIDPEAVVTLATRIASLAGTTLDVPAGPETIDFFLVVGLDRTSTAAPTSSCLTAGTNAQSAIELDLRDSLGHPLEGLTVLMTTDVGTLGPVVASGGTYRAVLTPPAIVSGPATIDITADGVTLAAQPGVSIAPPLTLTSGAAGGCPAEGNLRVRVVDEAGLPISGAHVMIGSEELTDPFHTIPGGTPDGPNTGFSNPDGYVEFVDFGTLLDGPQTVTAAATDRRYVTMLGIDAADTVLPLALVAPNPPTEVFEGDVTGISAPANDPIELGIMIPDLSFETLQSFSMDALLADSECYDAGGVAGSSSMPGNVYIPAQCALQVFFCIQQLPEHEYRSPDLTYGDRLLLALRADTPLAALTSGDIAQVLESVALDGIGVVPQTASNPGPTTANIAITNSLNPNLDCSIENAPANSDVACVAAGDWDSALDPDLSPGSGRLYAMGFRFGDSAGTTGPFVIPDVTTVAAAGNFAQTDYVAAAVAQYLDALKPGIPPGTENGTSAVLERSGTAFDGQGGSLTFNDFFPVRTLARNGREFSMSALPGAGHPEPNVTRVLLDRVITETYTACALDDSTRSQSQTLWEVFLPGTTTTWQLPTPPLGWPREDAGGDLAGLIDPAATLEDDALQHSAETLHLGTLAGFDYDRLRVFDIRLHATHVTRNQVGY